MRKRDARTLASVVFIAVTILGSAACSSDAAATAETPPVRHLEASIATFAQSHIGVISAAGGAQPGRCAVRLLGQSEQVQHKQMAYIEMLCSSVSPTTRCPTTSSSAGVGAAVATLVDDRRVTGIAVDDQDDNAYNQWINKRFPASLRHLENHSPHYGHLLNQRVLDAHHC